MSVKPFQLQAPEQIAKEYGGNKQKIAQAIQTGRIDPTAGALAGMFIDEMRAAQAAEQAPKQTIAQQIFAPPPPPAPPPMPGAPPMGAPPMGGGALPPPMPQGGPPPMPMPQGGPPMTAADGGLMSTSGGLTTLPVPEHMFDEPEGVSMAKGGIIAFAEGTKPSTEEIALSRAPESAMYGGGYTDALKNLDVIKKAYGNQSTEAQDAMAALFQKNLTPEAVAAQKKQDLWSALGQIGFNMAASKSPYFLQSLGEAGAAAIPGMEKAAAARKAEQMQAMQGMASIETNRNAANRDVGKGALDLAAAAQKDRQALVEMYQRGEISKAELAAALARSQAEIKAARENNIRTTNATLAGQNAPTDFVNGVNFLAAGMAKDPRYKNYSKEEIKAEAVRSFYRSQPGGQAVSQKAVEDINKTYRIRLATAKEKDKPDIQAQWDAAIANAFDGGGGGGGGGGGTRIQYDANGKPI